ncbi:MAG: HigA family addiction module antidote protein [Acidobacteriia bacterium]|nr:HigA family addiction module antidote protein [Terriglobia bacterium]
MSYQRSGPAAWALHPGEILKQEFLKPLKLSGYALAKGIRVTPQSVSDIVLKKKGISADMAVRLGVFFNTTPEFWMNLQAAYELATARQQNKKQVAKIRPYHHAA